VEGINAVSKVKDMMLSNRDKQQIAALGISHKQVLAQIERFEKEAPYLKLNRPCTIGDGIRFIPEDGTKQLLDIYEEYAPKRELIKFVPASGAATRMFKTLLRFDNAFEEIQKESTVSKAQQGDKDSQDLLPFMNGIRRFAFYDDLKTKMAKDGFDTEALIDHGQFKEIIDYLLTEKGLGYAQLPKGLLKFHQYPEESRTAFEEHLKEAADYVRRENGTCVLHFTVSPEHRDKFEVFLDKARGHYAKRYGVTYQVDFSVQARSTDTIAVDLDDKPFRLNDGTLLFRPGGHGALIENLNNLNGDIIFIKNIDNVVPDRLKGHIFLWKRVLAGYLIRVQQKIFSYLEKLIAGPVDEKLLREAGEFADRELGVVPLRGRQTISAKEKQDFLIRMFNRPLRVCGMVRNVGEPGGGPFWVESEDGSLSLQIVENAQVDPESEQQQKILASATHFNPVDIVCGVRDWQGKPFNLKEYVDSEAVFISLKSKDGRDLKALELPGLWNGAMAYWNTIFVEVPLITFNPVKTVNNLLRKEHQP